MKKLFLLFLILNISCGTDEGPPVLTNSKVIYGKDDRVFTHKSKDKMAKNLARSTFAMIDRDLIKSHGYDTIKIIGEKTPFCEGEAFAKSILAPTCSGFLAGPDILVTAGHCVKHADSCEKQKWVLDFKENLKRTDNTVILSYDKVYHCKEIILTKFSGVDTEDDDYAIIRLDRRVRGRLPLKFRTEGKIPDFSETVLIGHPIGLPQIITPFARVKDNKGIKRFYDDSDAFGGNSGSAVFNMDSGIVEGILVTGLVKLDFEKDMIRKCLKMGVLKDFSGPAPSGVYRITQISNYLSALVNETSLYGEDNYPKNFWQRLFDEDERKLEKLINEGLDINISSDRGENLLHWAVKKEKFELARFLIGKKINIDFKNHYEETPLFHAVRIKDFDMADMLIYYGANINARNRHRVTLLHTAAEVGNLDVLIYLLNKGFDINVTDADNSTPLLKAIFNGKSEIVKELVGSPKIDINKSDKHRISPLLAAAAEGYLKIFKLILNHPDTWDINMADDEGTTPLIVASMRGNIEIIKLLLRQRIIQVNKVNKYGENALFWAYKKGHTDIVRLLQRAGAR